MKRICLFIVMALFLGACASTPEPEPAPPPPVAEPAPAPPPPPEPVEEPEPAPIELPKTASSLPAVGFAGALGLAGAVVVHWARRRFLG
ncbi:MAG: LPXTG cell wall anchor domain-containing protein [Myxococcota bacterium]